PRKRDHGMDRNAMRHQAREEWEIEVAAYRVARGVGHCGDRRVTGEGSFGPSLTGCAGGAKRASNAAGRPRTPPLAGRCGARNSVYESRRYPVHLASSSTFRKEVIQCLIVIRRGRRLA